MGPRRAASSRAPSPANVPPLLPQRHPHNLPNPITPQPPHIPHPTPTVTTPPRLPTCVVLGRVDPEHRLAQPVPLALGPAVLEGRVHDVGRHALRLKQPLHEEGVPRGEGGDGEDADRDLGVVRVRLGGLEGVGG